MADESQPGSQKVTVPARVAFLIVVALVVMILAPIGGMYNDIVRADIKVEQAKGNIQTVLQKRADLIPNVVNSVEGSAVFEKNTLVDVIRMRAAATNPRASVEDIEKADAGIAGLVSRLLLVQEQYPNLKTTDQFIGLENDLRQSESDILVARLAYNDAAKNYKELTRSFPSGWVASLFHYSPDKWPMYTVSTPAAENPPEVKFDYTALA